MVISPLDGLGMEAMTAVSKEPQEPQPVTLRPKPTAASKMRSLS
jgi:hypothetical protein